MELYDAEVCADGNCRPGDDVNTIWYKVDEPGTVDFGDKNVVKTWASFAVMRTGRMTKKSAFWAPLE